MCRRCDYWESLFLFSETFPGFLSVAGTGTFLWEKGFGDGSGSLGREKFFSLREKLF